MSVFICISAVALRQVSVGFFGVAEEGEDIRVHVWPLAGALKAVQDGRIDNAASIIALQWLALNKEQVKADWLRL